MTYNPLQYGQKTKAASQSFTLASDQEAIPVTQTGAATEAKQNAIIGYIDELETLLSALVMALSGTLNVNIPAGAATEATVATMNGKVITCNTGAVTISTVTQPTAIVGEQKTVGTSASQLASNAAKSGFTLKADDDNTGNIYLGTSGVTAANALFRLKAGQAVFVSIDNANRLYAIASAASQKLYVIGS